MAADTAGTTRLVALVGPPGGGKTALVRALTRAAGGLGPQPGTAPGGQAVAGRTPGAATPPAAGPEAALGGPATDAPPAPTVWPELTSVVVGGTVVDLLDLPGHPDLVARVRVVLPAVDAVVFVLAADAGLDEATRLLWEECADAGLPRGLAVSGLDRTGAEFTEVLALAERVLGEGVAPLHLPLHDGDAHRPGAVRGLLNLLTGELRDYSGPRPAVRAADPEHHDLTAGARADLIELLLAGGEDPTALDAYLDGGEPTARELSGLLREAVAGGWLFPVVPVDPAAGAGTLELLDLLATAFPAPAERASPVVLAPDGSPVAAPGDGAQQSPLGYVLATRTTPQGTAALVRVLSGPLRPTGPLAVTRIGERPRPALSAQPERGSPPTLPPPAYQAGQTGWLAGLDVRAGETLSDPSQPRAVVGWELPTAGHPVGLEIVDGAGDVLARLRRLAADDPTASVEVDPGTGQVVLWASGPAQAEHFVAGAAALGIGVRAGDAPVALRARWRPGPGAVGDPDTEWEVTFTACPGPPGTGMQVRDEVAGGVPPTCGEQLVRALSAPAAPIGPSAPDVVVRLLRCEPAVPASATGGAATGPHPPVLQIWEPVLAVQVQTSDGTVGPVISDLKARRARITGTRPQDTADGTSAGRSVITAEVPASRMFDYVDTLRALSRGAGGFRRSFLRYAPLPPPWSADGLPPPPPAGG